jgi:hypothetical protein
MANGLCLGEGTEKSNHRHPGCCARAPSGHVAAAPPMSVMNSGASCVLPPARIGPYHIVLENAALCSTAKLAADVADGS